MSHHNNLSRLTVLNLIALVSPTMWPGGPRYVTLTDFTLASQTIQRAWRTSQTYVARLRVTARVNASDTMTFHTNCGENYDEAVFVNPLPPVGKRSVRKSPRSKRAKVSPVRLSAVPQGKPGEARPKRTSYIQRRIEDAKDSVVDDDFINFVTIYHNID